MKTLEEMLASLPPERRKKIELRAQELIEAELKRRKAKKKKKR